MTYLLILLYISYCIYNYDIKRTSQASKSYKILFVIFTLIAGLSYRIGFDSIGYEYMFNYNYSYTISWKELFGDITGFQNSQEPLWYLLNWLFYHLIGEFWIMKFVIALFVNYTVFWFIKRHCGAPFIAILIYFIYGFIEYNFETLRQAIAIGFTLIALDKLIGANSNGFNLYKYYFYLIPAFFFHHFAIIAIFFPFLTRLKLNFQVVFIALGVSIALGYLMEITIGISQLSFISSEMSINLINKMNSEEYGIYGGLNIIGIISKLVTLILPGIVILRCHKGNSLVSLSIIFYILTFVQFYFHFLYRVADFLIIPLSVALADSFIIGYKCDNLRLNRISPNVLKWCFAAVIIIKSLSFVRSENWNVYYPYSSIIDKTIYPERERNLQEHRYNDYYQY